MRLSRAPLFAHHPVVGRARHTAVHRSGDGCPEVYLHVDGKPVAEALTLDKGTVT